MTRRLAALTSLAIAVAWTAAPVTGFSFLNWDDHAVIVQNPRLEFPGVLGWSLSTLYMEHYQPLSWLAWAALKHAAGLDARVFHAANAVAHVVVVLLLWWAVRVLLRRAAPQRPPREHDAVAWAAALLYGVHPLRVEVVAWISALPYALALALLLGSLIAHVAPTTRLRTGRAVSVLLYAASLAARPIALGYPIVLVVVDTCLLGRQLRASLARVWPYAGLAVAAAVVESVARASGRNDSPWLDRLQAAVTAPFFYLWQTIAPIDLTPLALMPAAGSASLAVVIAAAIALAAVSTLAWRSRAFTAAWAIYLALLLPAAGLFPSGLQATADRYAYLPGTVVATVIAIVTLRWASGHPHRLRVALALVIVVAGASALASRRVLAHWSDSVTLWSRVVALSPQHDVGLYNLASAHAERSESDEAMRRYRELLTLHADHAPARANLARLEAVALEREGNDLAARGELAAAADRYQEALSRDPGRAHSHAARGMALATLGRTEEAVPALRHAIRLGIDDAAVSNALAGLLQERGEIREARATLEAALARHQTDVGLAHNLARLLAMAPTREGDTGTALRLARAVVEATGGRDPRALDTLAAAQAAGGDLDRAAATSARAARLAASQGDHDLAVQITARGSAYRRPGQ